MQAGVLERQTVPLHNRFIKTLLPAIMVFFNVSYRTILADGRIGSPLGVAVDWVNRNVYWTDDTKVGGEIIKKNLIQQDSELR